MLKTYKKLQKIRKKAGLSYEEIARQLGISKSFYWQIEHKKRRLYYNMAVKIAKLFDLKPDDLFY